VVAKFPDAPFLEDPVLPPAGATVPVEEELEGDEVAAAVTFALTLVPDELLVSEEEEETEEEEAVELELELLD
jgi:hypothetical protein